MFERIFQLKQLAAKAGKQHMGILERGSRKVHLGRAPRLRKGQEGGQPRSEKIRKAWFSDFFLSSPPGRRGERYAIKGKRLTPPVRASSALAGTFCLFL